MAKVESKAVHVQIRHDEAMDCKRMFLESQLHLVSAVKSLLSFRELRKEELDARKDARAIIQDISKRCGEISEMLPVLEEAEEQQGMKGFDLQPKQPRRHEIKQVKEKKKIMKPAKKDKKSRLNDELESIKSRLESMK
jgi:hypothetical protein